MKTNIQLRKDKLSKYADALKQISLGGPGSGRHPEGGGGSGGGGGENNGDSKINPIGKKLKTETKEYSWGKLTTISDGNNWRAVLHPEHQEQIKNLKINESTSFIDEQRIKWNVQKIGENEYNIKNNSGENGNFKL